MLPYDKRSKCYIDNFEHTIQLERIYIAICNVLQSMYLTSLHHDDCKYCLGCLCYL
jgi:hypothetical protein